MNGAKNVPSLVFPSDAVLSTLRNGIKRAFRCLKAFRRSARDMASLPATSSPLYPSLPRSASYSIEPASSVPVSSIKPKRADWISLIEAGYNLEGSEQQWLDNLRDHAEGLLEASAARWAFVAHYSPTTCHLGVTRFPKIMGPFGHLFHASLDEPTIDLIYRQGHIVDTASNLLFPKPPYQCSCWKRWQDRL